MAPGAADPPPRELSRRGGPALDARSTDVSQRGSVQIARTSPAAAAGATRRFRVIRPYSLADYWLTSIAVGVRALPGPYPREALARILNPLSYPRMMEYALIRELLGGFSGKTLLDVGSPKLPVLLIAREPQTELVATDIRDYFIRPTAHFLQHTGRVASEEAVRLEVADARHLPYPDASFDAIYSISVLEHIPDAGDAEAVRELGRVLKPGGAVAITVPFDHSGCREDWLEDDVYERRFEREPIFYQRHYDCPSLHARLVAPSGLSLERLEFFGEPGFHFEARWNRIPMKWKVPLLWAQPFVARLFLKRLGIDDAGHACGVALLLRKPATDR